MDEILVWHKGFNMLILMTGGPILILVLALLKFASKFTALTVFGHDHDHDKEHGGEKVAIEEPAEPQGQEHLKVGGLVMTIPYAKLLGI